MKTIQTVLAGGMMAFALAACKSPETTTDASSMTSSGSSSTGVTAAGSTGNPTVDAQMGITPNDTQNAPANPTGSGSTPTNTGHTTTNSTTGQ